MTDQDAFARTLSLAVHEFRTPVTVAAGYLRMILSEQAGPLTDRQRKLIEEADRACKRISALVADMSDLGKLVSKEMALPRQPVDVNALLAEVAGHMHEGDDRGVHLDVQASDRPARVMGDRARISAALGALLHAALRERGEPGTVAARCSVVQDPDTTWAVVVIGDNGQLDALAASRREPPAFEEWRGGVGFSLLLARRVIEAHGGAVWSGDGAHARAAVGLRLPVAE
jgi:signal transduction histidine kinase